MYNDFYGFKEKPFSLTPDPHFLYLSSAHRKALAYLTYGLEDKKGFITVTGEVGAGKTTLIRALLRNIDSKTTVARIINTTISSLQLLKMVVRDFGINTTALSKDDLLESLNTFLLKQYSIGHSAVIIVDEAQNLGISTLEEIRLLSNLETEKDKLLQIILVGQPELRQTLAQPQLRQLRQRITVNYHISPLNEQEVAEYIKHRITVAGANNPDLFSNEALNLIAKASKGIPRLVNVICDAALVTGYVESSQTIEGAFVNEVLNDLDLNYDVHSEDIFAAPKAEKTLHKDVDQLCQHYRSQQTSAEEDLEEKSRHLEEQMENANALMQRLMEKEKELEERTERITEKEKRLGI